MTVVASLNSTAAATMTRAIIGGVVMLGIILLGASLFHERYHVTKKMFYGALAASVVAVTSLLATFSLNLLNTSTTGILERRTARYYVSVCDEQLRFVSSNSLTKRVGGPRQYIYNDRMVMQSVFADERDDASLGGMIRSLGGSISTDVILIPINMIEATPQLETFEKESPLGRQYVEFSPRTGCGASEGALTVFVYKYDENKNQYTQYHVKDPASYVFSTNADEKQDCIVLLYGKSTTLTDQTCSGYPQQYQLGGEI